MRRLLVAFLLIASSPALASVPADPGLAAPLARAMEAAERSLDEQELQAAESHYRSALLEGWLLLGGLAAAEGEPAEAKAAFEQAAVSAAQTRRAHTSLAIVQLRLGDPAAALTLLRQVVARRPDDGVARRLLAQALVAAGNPEEAVQELQEALAAAGGDDPETAFTLATGLLRLGKVEEAEQLFDRLAGQLPTAQTQVLIGRTYRDFQQYDRARAALEKALELDPEVRRAHYYLGSLALLSRGRDALAAAIASFHRELETSPQDPMTHLYLGMALAEERRFEEAVPSLQLAAGWEPTRLDALRFLGRCHLALDRPAEAVAVLERSLALAEDLGARPRQLAGIHYQLGQALRRQGSGEQAARHLDAAQEVAVDLVEGERDRFASFLGDDFDFEPDSAILPLPAQAEAAKALGAAARRELERRVRTELARAYLNLGVLQARQQRFGRAAGLFSSAADLDPELPRLQASLGTALFNSGRYAEAADPLERALQSEPDNGEVKRMLALTRINLEQYERAVELLREDPRRQSDPALQVAFGLALVRSGRAAEAEGLFARLISENAEWPELHVFLGQAYAHQGNYPAAIASLERALELSPEVAEANAALGVIYLRQGRLEAAEKALRSELAHHPDDVRSRYHLAVVLDLAGRPEASRGELEAVLKVQPDRADARYLLGKIELAQGAAEEAALHLEAAAALAPEDASVRYQLAQAYQRLGKAELASRQFALYRDLKSRQRSEPQ